MFWSIKRCSRVYGIGTIIGLFKYLAKPDRLSSYLPWAKPNDDRFNLAWAIDSIDVVALFEIPRSDRW